MKTTPLDVIFQHLGNGAALEAVVGKLTKLFPRKSGTKAADNTPWSIQNGELTDNTGAVIPVMFKDCGEISKDWQNHTVALLGKHGDKGLSGLYVFDDTYNDSTVRKLKLTPTGTLMSAQEFFQINGQAQPTPGQPGPKQGTTSSPKPQGQPTTQQRPPQGQGQPRQQSGPPPKTGKPLPHGQTVGMAMNNAAGFIRDHMADYARAGGWTSPKVYLESAAFPKDLWTVASAMLRVSAYLEKGNLAPKGEEHHAPAPPAVVAKQTPPQRQPAPQDDWPVDGPGNGSTARHQDEHDSGDGPISDGLDDDEIPF